MKVKKLPGICFFGCGNIAIRHTRILKKLYPDIEISFASRSNIKSKEYTDKFDGKYSFSNYEDAAESDLFDIAFITTPHAFHSDLAVLAAKNKKNLIIEKPVTRNLSELLRLENAVNQNKVRCTIAENYYYKSFIQKIRGFIEKNYIGKILFIELNKTNKDTISGWRTDSEMMGGGALLEGGIHWVNALISLSGANPIEVIAFKPDVHYETNIPFEDSLTVCINFDNGAVGKLLHSWRIPNPLKGVGLSKIYGSDGIITFESNGLFVYISGKKKKFIFTNPTDFLGYKAMHRAFINAYISNEPWQPSLERIRLEMKLVTSAYKSLSSKKLEQI